MKNIATITLVLTVIAIIVFAPFIIIWALNTLFALGIEYTFWTWLAMLVVTGAFGKTHVKINKS